MTSAPEWLTITSFHERLTAAGFELNREWLGLIVRKANGPITKPGRLWKGAPTRLVLWPAARTWYVLYTAKRRTLPRPKNVDIDAIRKSLGLPLITKPLVETPNGDNITIFPVLEPVVPRKRGRPRKNAIPEIPDNVQVVIPKPSIKKAVAKSQVVITEFGRLQRCQLNDIIQWWSLGSAGERTLIWPL